MKKYELLATHLISSFDGVVVITSALHAEGREFDPRSKYFFFQNLTNSHWHQVIIKLNLNS